jgi:hypothetical protein
MIMCSRQKRRSIDEPSKAYRSVFRGPSAFGRCERALDKRGRYADNSVQSASFIVKSLRETLNYVGFFGATRRSRTDDLLITNRIY